jgi:actin related protein 2/3 complex subunit 5
MSARVFHITFPFRFLSILRQSAFGMSYIDTLKARGEQALRDVRSSPEKALKTVLEEMPVRMSKVSSNKDKPAFEAAKAVAAKNVLSVLVAIDQGKLSGAIKGLTDEERDTLMKFVYRGFSERYEVDKQKKCTYDCNILLKAHGEICSVSGLGPVIRSIHTRLEV